ncbi:MAG: PfkB family carbohydrate kinase [Chloroflexota bacterium]|nr:PfkB family carbohydrate kinase [Chloroflexota bacterium]
MIGYVTVGEITLDDTVREDGTLLRDQVGGGSIYSALGLHLWRQTVGVHAVIGREYPAEPLAMLAAAGVGIAGITAWDGWSLRLWLLHEEENRKQQVPRLRSASFAALDAARGPLPDSYLTASGVHLAPATPEGQRRARDEVRARIPGAIISLDLLTAPFIVTEPYRSGGMLHDVDLFLPSRGEVQDIWPGRPLAVLFSEWAACGPRGVAVKRDINGSLVYDRATDRVYDIPVYPTMAVDTTGAGDAYAGGFLAGWVETGSALEAGLWGTVSASFAVEAWGALHLLGVSRAAASERLTWLRPQVRQFPRTDMPDA